ncbi:hypothetical protein RUM44_013655 [Polyplax serrata]|uniref:Uncharacterized protein n=1 Tax=Polyplax serrata TaxID=468196 RepID=A0ABR1BGZ8_POLSC
MAEREGPFQYLNETDGHPETVVHCLTIALIGQELRMKREREREREVEEEEAGKISDSVAAVSSSLSSAVGVSCDAAFWKFEMPNCVYACLCTTNKQKGRRNLSKDGKAKGGFDRAYVEQARRTARKRASGRNCLRQFLFSASAENCFPVVVLINKEFKEPLCEALEGRKRFFHFFLRKYDVKITFSFSGSEPPPEPPPLLRASFLLIMCNPIFHRSTVVSKENNAEISLYNISLALPTSTKPEYPVAYHFVKPATNKIFTSH